MRKYSGCFKEKAGDREAQNGKMRRKKGTGHGIICEQEIETGIIECKEGKKKWDELIGDIAKSSIVRLR